MVDASVEGVTGLRVPIGDVQARPHAMKTLSLDPDLRARFGAAGRQRILSDFPYQVIVKAWLDFYHSLLN